MSKFLNEFKEFAVKGNMVDMAVGIIIGGAFGKIVSSLVNDIVMPLFAAIIGDGAFKDLTVTLKEAVLDPATGEEIKAAVMWNYGSFIQECVDFLIIAFVIFLLIKGINKMKEANKKEEAPAAPAGPTQEELLTEIRDLLKKN
ncbi:MAG: large-conductance mechanosensitive channel protein MscL [Bacteroidales bacterium]|nr:large-conductance mechanosensitive channel protein MscL [Bacteroidales bacterium]